MKESLDLCLACKGCKGDCPVNVDIATYKAEFLSHYYEGRLRPPYAYAMGAWSIGGCAWRQPRAATANVLANAPGVSHAIRWLLHLVAGSAACRRSPRSTSGSGREDTESGRRGDEGFSLTVLGTAPVPRSCYGSIRSTTTCTLRNHACGACLVLQAAGCEVMIPSGLLCCGRPLYDWGMLDLAKGFLRRSLGSGDEINSEGMPLMSWSRAACRCSATN